MQDCNSSLHVGHEVPCTLALVQLSGEKLSDCLELSSHVMFGGCDGESTVFVEHRGSPPVVVLLLVAVIVTMAFVVTGADFITKASQWQRMADNVSSPKGLIIPRAYTAE